MEGNLRCCRVCDCCIDRSFSDTWRRSDDPRFGMNGRGQGRLPDTLERQESFEATQTSCRAFTNGKHRPAGLGLDRSSISCRSEHEIGAAGIIAQTLREMPAWVISPSSANGDCRLAESSVASHAVRPLETDWGRIVPSAPLMHLS